jgi:thiol-disulfide isomerase/thioredoxin
MKKTIFLGLVAVAVASSCAPRSELPGRGALPAATAPAAATPAPALTAPIPAAELRDLMIAAGLAVPKEPMPAEDFALSSLEGANVKLSDYRGKVVFLNFWATWCPPCRSEMPSMERLSLKLKAGGLEILAVDLQEPKDTVQKFVKDNGISFTVLLDSTGGVGGAWGAQSIPTTYLIDRKGAILARAIGAREWDSPDMVTLFEAILAAK